LGHASESQGEKLRLTHRNTALRAERGEREGVGGGGEGEGQRDGREAARARQEKGGEKKRI